MRRGVLVLAGIAICALGAAGLTELTLAVGQRHTTSEPSASGTPSPTASPSPTPTPTPRPSIAPTPVSTLLPTPAARQATTSSFVRLRAQPTTSSAILEGLNGGTVVTLTAYQDAQWQGVTVHGFTGYIFRSYLNY